MNDNHYAVLKNGESAKHKFSTPSSTTTQSSIRITLVYTDYPGASGASMPLVNDLDMVVVNEYGDVLHKSQSTVNNVESIVIDYPSPNTIFTLIISSSKQLVYPQSYALVMTGEINQNATKQTSVQQYMRYISNSFATMSGSTLVIFVFVVMIILLYCYKNLVLPIL